MAEFERIEKISHLRIFTHNIKIRKFMISCCDLHVPLSLARKKFKDLTTSEFVYSYLDIVNSESPEKQAVI